MLLFRVSQFCNQDDTDTILLGHRVLAVKLTSTPWPETDFDILLSNQNSHSPQFLHFHWIRNRCLLHGRVNNFIGDIVHLLAIVYE